MTKHTIKIIIVSFVFTILLYNTKVFASDIPEHIEGVNYFLQEINTPFWIGFFRTAFCVCILGILISFFYYQNKKD